MPRICAQVSDWSEATSVLKIDQSEVIFVALSSWSGTHGQGTFSSLVLVCLPKDHEYVNCHRDITEIMLKGA